MILEKRPGLRRAALRACVLAGLLAGHVLLGVWYGLHTPLFESPDEAGHYLFVRYLQAYGRLPVQTAVFDAPRAHHPPLYFWLAAWLTRGVAIAGSPDTIQATPNPHFGFRPADDYPDNKAVYLHNGPDERWPFAGQARAVHLVRLLSLAFSTVAVAATFGAAAALRPGSLSFAALAAGLVAFNPMVLFMTGQVSNDTAALASGAVVVYLLNAFARRGFTWWGWALVGLALAAGLLLKTSALVLLVPIGVALLSTLRRGLWWRQALAAGLAIAAPPLVLSGWWYWRNVQLYGDLTGNAAVALVNGRLTPDERWLNLPRNLAWLAQGVLGCGPLGPFSVCFPAWVDVAAAALALLAGLGLVRLARRRGWTALTTPSGRRWLVPAALAGATLAAVLIYALTYWNAWSGRLLFPAYAALALLLAAGILAWVQRPRGQTLLAAALLALNAALAAYGVLGLIVPRYGIPPTPSAAALPAMTPLDAQLGDVARVLGYHLEASNTHPGGTLDVTIYWQPLAASTVPYTVFLHLYDPALGSLAQRDTYPGLGNYATTLWEPNRVFADTYRLYLPPETPATTGAYLLLGLYDEATGQRLAPTGPAADPSEKWLAFGAVTVGP